MGNTTLLFLIRKQDNKISHICLAMKKRSFGVGRWNGVGGKLLPGESTEEGVKREAAEEIGVVVRNLSKAAILSFIFSDKNEWNQTVHVYLCDNWDNEPIESEEMNPMWFSSGNLPFSKMWPSDALWLPALIGGKFLKGSFTLGENDSVLEHKVESVESF